MSSPAIFGCSGSVLTDAEHSFFREANPWGFILFARNIETPEQVSTLTGALRKSVGRDAPILIDQEGGRVARLRAPHWRKWGAALDTASAPALSEEERCDALRLRYRLIGDELRAVGIDVNCAPLLDIPQPNAHDIIGDRALGHDADTVTRRGRAVCAGLLEAGVLPVIKHVPGHGRAMADSHEALPRVDSPLSDLQASDFAPFAAFGASPFTDAPLAMTAHIVYDALDPDACATLSRKAIRYMRETLGLQSLLMTDDLSMKALSGDFSTRTALSLAAGCDLILHCNGDADEMQAIATALPRSLSASAQERSDRALALRTLRPVEDDAEARYAVLAEKGGFHG